MRRLIESAIPTQAELDRGRPAERDPVGREHRPNTGPKPDNLTDPEEGDGFWRKVERGAERVGHRPEPHPSS